MKIKSFLMATFLVILSAQAENKISYFESDAKYHDDFVLVTLQSGDYRSFKICNRFMYKAGTLDHSNPEHCSLIGKSSYQYLNSNLVAYKNRARIESETASRFSKMGWGAMWSSIAVPTLRTAYQYMAFSDNLLTLGESISKNRYWLISGSIVAAVTGYVGSIQGEIQNDRNLKIKALEPATAPILSGASLTIDMKITDYSKLLNDVLIQLENEGLIKGQSL